MKPKDVWSYERELVLKPGQSDSVEVVPDVKLASGTNASIAMTVGDKTVYPVRMTSLIAFKN